MRGNQNHGFDNRAYLEAMRDEYPGEYGYVPTARYAGLGLPWSEFTRPEIEWQLEQFKAARARMELHNKFGGRVGAEAFADLDAKIAECEAALAQ